ncbi:MAG: hypothetical protein JO332_12330, partial [Planctomycetaceae bacterium]|nr:hypothetical protein [Planctomycetaceae bacterium]
MSQKKLILIVVGVLVVLGLVLVFRTPIRKAWRRGHARHEPSKGMLKNPEAIAFDTDGTVYVGNQDSSDIAVLNPDGSFRSKFDRVEGYVGGDGAPVNISRGLYMQNAGPGRLILTAVHNVAELDVSGSTPKLVRIIGKKGSAPGEMDGPEGLSRDVNGDIYVTDEHNRRLNVFKAD